MSDRPLGNVACVAALSALAALYGCGSKDAASYVSSAKAYLAGSQYKSAIIEAKNALQADPRNAEARLLLAQALLRSGDPSGAESEVRKAIDAGAPADTAYPVLARALVTQGEFAKATKELGTRRLESAEARADLAITLANANAAQGNLKDAQAGVDEVLALDARNLEALLLDAQLAARGGDMAAARKHVDAALARDPKNVQALAFKARLELAGGHLDEGIKLMEQAVDAQPDAIEPRAALTTLAVTTNKLDIAKAQVAKMKELAPNDARTLYSDALVAYAAGDNAHARDVVQKLMTTYQENLPVVMLSGLVDLRFGSLDSAQEKLRRVVDRAPLDDTARRALATAEVRSGRPQEALDVIRPALARKPDDPSLLRLAGEAYLASGRASDAQSAYERANAIDKNDVASQVRLAQVRFATGDSERAFNDLETLSQKDASATQADLALFSAHLKRREFDKALAVADDLAKKQPKSPVGANLRGVVFLAKRDLANARQSFEKALSIQPDYLPAAQSLATIDIQEGKLQAARDRYDGLLRKDPKNERLLLASAQLLELSGATRDQVREALDKAVAANPGAVQSRLARITFELRHQDAKAALAAATAATAAIPKNMQLLEMLANAQLANGDANQAIETLKQMAVLQPNNPLVLVRLAQVQTAVKDYASALTNEQKALEIQPGLSVAWVALAKTYLASGKPDAALAEARKLQKEHGDKSLGYAIEGELLSAEKKPADAAAAFRKGLAREPASALAVRTYNALQAAGMKAEAHALASQWNKEHPKDTALLLVVAEQDQARKDYGAALDGYKRVLATDGDNVSALNNMAWIFTEQGDPKAVEYAERAHRLAPFNPNVLDTLGWALTRTGDPKRGTQLLQMAVAGAPNSPEIRLHLGKAQLDSGNKPAARQTLTELSKLDKDSPVRAEAEKLLATM
ncbi:MAG TPA: XrtA/PEP-CTERM system TPR-repeat protein PrsT [Casimicrobiaceae bacterium]|nr:XrtA/PEP-CTERM system TPR-repeat protein PrsT [Casimicrobiaceae bacterium]